MILIFPFLIMAIYVGLIVAVVYFIFKWVNTFIALKEEHNDLLREIINKMDHHKQEEL